MTDSSLKRDVRIALRQATAALHAQVDTVMPLAAPAPSLSDYASHVRLLLQWTLALPRLPATAARLGAQAAVLQADLAACGERVDACGGFHQDVRAHADTGHAAYGWGMAYVIEGSHLGGQVLYRRLAASLAPHPLDYLRGAGQDTGARWTAFLAELRSQVRADHEIDLACRGAVDAFELLLECHRRATATAGAAA